MSNGKTMDAREQNSVSISVSVEEAKMLIIARAVTYASLFIGFMFIYLPARLLSWTGIGRPEAAGWPQVAGVLIGSIGAVAALSCVWAFVMIGKGTPAPFDPPRRLVVRGPYRFVRNPMYLGAGLALAGAALFYVSAPLLVYAVLFLLAAHCFVVYYEEPTLRRSFGPDYESYCQRVSRWWPGVQSVP
jgi:protein-S-isoprenylcysteine O-methyltransferase Ste14